MSQSPANPPSTRAAFTLAVTGQSLIKEDVLAGAAPDVQAVAALTRSADFSFTGYEGAIAGAHGGWPMKQTFLHVSPPAVLDTLRAMGFNLLSLSNNIFQPAKYTGERIWQSVVAKCCFAQGRCQRIELTPLVIGGERALREGNFQARRAPHVAHGAYGVRILERLADLSAGFGTRIDIAGDIATITLSASSQAASIYM